MTTQFAIAYVIFNRPRHTRESFKMIRAQRPAKLFIIADGPRVGHPTDAARCAEVRLIVEQIDWPCEVHHNFADQNMGCKLRVSSGLDWVFSQVEAAVVIEDDCVPNADFFSFCDDLLVRYANDERVWVITGNNFQDGKKHGEAAYYFSKYNHCWGWATWSRAWKHYRVDIPFWPKWQKQSSWRQQLPDRIEREVWATTFDRVQRGEIDTWDYQWTACVWYHGGLTATPNVNLVSNIGFGPEATHTVTGDDQVGLPTQALGVLTHPKQVVQNTKADRFVFNRNFGGSTHPKRLRNRLKGHCQRLLRAPAWLLKKLNQVRLP